MIQHNSMMVSTFMSLYVPDYCKARFKALMVEWDRDEWSDGNTVLSSFYDVDLLNVKRAESMEV